MVNVEISDETGTHRVLMARFPRTKVAIGTMLISVLVLGLPWLIVPLSRNDSGLSPWVLSLAVVLVGALVFGWFLVPLFMIALRGGYLALAPMGVLIRHGLGSVLIPWAAIESVAADTTGMAVVFTSPGADQSAGYPVLRVRLRTDLKVPGWPWPAVLSSALLGSSRRALRIPAWWLQPVPLDWLVALLRFLLTHPDERQRLGDVDPGVWDLVPAPDQGGGHASRRGAV
jgi:hypothetical protein